MQLVASRDPSLSPLSRRRWPVAALLAALGLGAAGCAPPIDPATAAAEGRSFGGVQVDAPGPARFVGDAFAEVPLDPTQRAHLEAMAASTAARHRAIAAAMRAAASAVAEQIERGRVDRAALEPRIDAIAAAWADAQPADRRSVQELHGLLDIEQRQMLADALEDRVEAHLEGAPLHAKWRAWREELALTDAQAEAIADDVRARVSLGWHDWVGEKRRAREADRALDAFVEEGFELDEELPPVDVRALVAERAERVLAAVEAALPHLTPEQRRRAADRIRRRGDQDLP